MPQTGIQEGSEAVSPVLGVVFMLAATVALGALVFLVGRTFTDGQSEPAPLLGVVQDNREGSMEAVTAQSGADWSKVRLASPNPLRAQLNGLATAASPQLPLFVAPSEQPVMAADGIHFCGDGGVQFDVRVVVSYVTPLSTQELVELRFPVIPACQ